jgi:hypothetical protein
MIIRRFILNNIKIPTFGGIEQNKSPLRIAENRCADASNVLLNNPYGALNNALGIVKLSDSGAGKPINALWQMRNKDVVYQRGGYWINGAWEEGTAEELFDIILTQLNLTTLGSFSYLYYFSGFIWFFETPSSGNITLSKVDMGGNRTVQFSTDSRVSRNSIKIDEINSKVYYLKGNSICISDLYSFVESSFGTTGSDINQFDSPFSLYLDTSYVYAIAYDYVGNSKITGTMVDQPPTDPDPDGDIIGTWTSLNLYVADSNNYRVVKTKFDGSIWKSIGSFKDPSEGYENFKFASYPRQIIYLKENGVCLVSEYPHVYNGQTYVSLIKLKIDGSYWVRTSFLYGESGQSLASAPEIASFNGSIFLFDGSERIIKTDINFSTWDEVSFSPLYPLSGTFNKSTGELFYRNPGVKKIYKTDYFAQ